MEDTCKISDAVHRQTFEMPSASIEWRANVKAAQVAQRAGGAGSEQGCTLTLPLMELDSISDMYKNGSGPAPTLKKITKTSTHTRATIGGTPAASGHAVTT